MIKILKSLLKLIGNMKKFSNKKTRINQRGFMAVVVVIVISIVALIMSQNSTKLSLGDLEISYDYAKGEEAVLMAEGCANYTLEQIRKNSNYGLSGNVDLIIKDGHCTIVVTGTGAERTIEVKANIGSYFSEILVELDLNDKLTITNWEIINI